MCEYYINDEHFKLSTYTDNELGALLKCLLKSKLENKKKN